MKKVEKIAIIRWYIKNYIQTDFDYNSSTNLKELEEIVRTEMNLLGEKSRCNNCTSDNRDYCPRCANCIEHNRNSKDSKDNYHFSYNHYKRFAFPKS